MTHLLGPKAIACLELAEVAPLPFEIWEAMYEKVCAEYSEKAVVAKLEELTDRGLVDYGVSARMAWLTDEGKAALARSREG